MQRKTYKLDSSLLNWSFFESAALVTFHALFVLILSMPTLLKHVLHMKNFGCAGMLPPKTGSS
jgi:hypothetical protein